MLSFGDPVLSFGDPVLSFGDPVLSFGDPVFKPRPEDRLSYQFLCFSSIIPDNGMHNASE